jgi:hypothetical protein
MSDGARNDHGVIFYGIARRFELFGYRIDDPMRQSSPERLCASPVEIHDLDEAMPWDGPGVFGSHELGDGWRCNENGLLALEHLGPERLADGRLASMRVIAEGVGDHHGIEQGTRWKPPGIDHRPAQCHPST